MFEEDRKKLKKMLDSGEYEYFNFSRMERGVDIETNEKLEELIEDKSLQGQGTISNPYIIEKIELPREYFLSNITVYSAFRNYHLDKLDLFGCKNISIENCKFEKLTITRCKNLQIINCEINILNLNRVKNCQFNQTSFRKIYRDYSDNNGYEKCLFPEQNQIFDNFMKQNIVPRPKIFFFLIIASLIAIIFIFLQLN
ncbi:MAG: hypothetical protein EAX91_13875 [Candidatus Lokiarchaeota archaeon]|nr:hypothetical protein [Candidatus Lokiarchaeota archaeon]